MQLDFEMPAEVPVMTLPRTVLFPEAMMPLHIFEPRYRKMLRDVLRRNRIFAIASLDETLAQQSGHFEPTCQIAAVGVIRACRHYADGTSNLLLQGLYRVQVKSIIHEEPYRIISIAALQTTPGLSIEGLQTLKERTTYLLEERKKIGGDIPAQSLKFINKLDDTEAFIDLAAFTFCSDYPLKQKLLETLDTGERYQHFLDYLEKENTRLKLLNTLRGNLTDEEIEQN